MRDRTTGFFGGPGFLLRTLGSLVQRCHGWQPLTFMAASLLILAGPAWSQLRVVNYNIAQLRGNLANLQNVFAAMHDDDKPGFAVPVAIFVFQEVRSTDINTLESVLNAAAPVGVSYTRGTFTTSASEDSSGGAQAMFYRTGFLIQQSHMDIPTGAGRNTDRWLLRLNGYNSIFAWMYVYGSHLKSDTGAANEATRLNGVIAIRNNADALGANLHMLFCGDMNFYHNNESGYLHFFSNGNAQAVDPLGTGPWNGSVNPPNNANNFKHTQSPLLVAANGLVGGGMDDRFDFQLSTAPMHDGAGLAMFLNTYRALGNDGLHYDQAIDNGNNFYYPGQLARSNALATNLRLASDHIPVIVDYQIPAMMAANMPTQYGRVIVNTPFTLTMEVTNPAPVLYDFGADLLDYTAVASLNLSGSASDTVEPLGDVSSAGFPLNTAFAGIKNGTVTLSSSSQGVQPASLVLNTTGTVVRRSDPSFSGAMVITQQKVSQEFDADTGTHAINVNVHNFGFDALQALLDIDDVSKLAPPFALISGSPTSNIAAAPATLTFSFNTTGLANGTYAAPITIHTSDEDIPGESAATLELSLVISVNGAAVCAADVTGDLIVNVNDLLAIINQWGACPQSGACAADVTGDGLVNVNDLLTVINAWGLCP